MWEVVSQSFFRNFKKFERSVHTLRYGDDYSCRSIDFRGFQLILHVDGYQGKMTFANDSLLMISVNERNGTIHNFEEKQLMLIN